MSDETKSKPKDDIMIKEFLRKNKVKVCPTIYAEDSKKIIPDFRPSEIFGVFKV